MPKSKQTLLPVIEISPQKRKHYTTSSKSYIMTLRADSRTLANFKMY